MYQYRLILMIDPTEESGGLKVVFEVFFSKGWKREVDAIVWFLSSLSVAFFYSIYDW